MCDALRAREIIKMKLLDNCEFSPMEATTQLAEKNDSIVVQTIGNKLVLYKKNPKDPKIKL